MNHTIKLSGVFDFDLEIPDSMIDRFAAAMLQKPSAEPAKPVPTAYPDSQNGKQAEVVADFLKEAGKTGATETQIKNRFSAIRSTEQLRSVLKLLPSMLYRKSDGLWTYQFA